MNQNELFEIGNERIYTFKLANGKGYHGIIDQNYPNSISQHFIIDRFEIKKFNKAKNENNQLFYHQ
ncbi:hypothetical protein [Cytophaga hutchinsonii]|uniref:Uncharacterized protein n=1 Tax=Cytophaga hutchinsonii (strain ATCC 33406 / DSM 1761 / CIP 103989 / NBRC 15051 / NCIMB 9469 / D465) TaxID=269798 RepID=A0A6N4SS24_CYTH3|nr:hypothetical protein [Cytophaga hutchinsonii]ABG59173.1 hypothetical protein CHU_1907 [Cytophaga hutchinsonii ATCC 33406]SFX35003.1 hypothetical protein SAMN04487930_103134 [Cytophaga hutchinsonii ATCC 33406]